VDGSASVPEPAGCLRLVLSSAARRDIYVALTWSEDRFGEAAADRYRELLKQALRDVTADPERPGLLERSELGNGIRTYHLFFSRSRAKRSVVGVKNPRHILVYRRRGEAVVHVVRVLHDACDLERHLPST
jgi:toxin ParE1/3/4